MIIRFFVLAAEGPNDDVSKLNSEPYPGGTVPCCKILPG